MKLKKNLFAAIVLVFLLSSFYSNAGMKRMIKWKKIETKAQAENEMLKYVAAGDPIEKDFRFLNNERHEYIIQQGDSVIYFHSPLISVRPLSLVGRKWMYTFHYTNKTCDRIIVEEGLVGP